MGDASGPAPSDRPSVAWEQIRTGAPQNGLGRCLETEEGSGRASSPNGTPQAGQRASSGRRAESERTNSQLGVILTVARVQQQDPLASLEPALPDLEASGGGKLVSDASGREQRERNATPTFRSKSSLSGGPRGELQPETRCFDVTSLPGAPTRNPEFRSSSLWLARRPRTRPSQAPSRAPRCPWYVNCIEGAGRRSASCEFSSQEEKEIFKIDKKRA